MVADDLGHQRKPEAGTVGLGGDERIEQDRHQVRRHARAVILDDDLQRQRDALGQQPWTEMRMPGRNAVENLISAFGVRSRASAAFFTRFRNTWMSWSRLPPTGGSDGSYSSWKLMPLATPFLASSFTRSRMTWMLIGSRSIGRSSPNTSTRSIRSTMRSTSSRTSRASGSSSAVTLCSSSCAAPRMPESGFLISCARHRGEPGHRARRAAADQLPVDLVGHGALLEQQRDAAVGIGKR